MAAVVAEPSPQAALLPLEQLEHELGAVYMQILQQHGAGAALKVIGRLMVSCPTGQLAPAQLQAAPPATPAAAAVAAPPPPAPAPLRAPDPVAPAAAAAAAALPCASTAGADARVSPFASVASRQDAVQRSLTGESTAALPSGASSLVSPSTLDDSESRAGDDTEREMPPAAGPPPAAGARPAAATAAAAHGSASVPVAAAGGAAGTGAAATAAAAVQKAKPAAVPPGAVPLLATSGLTPSGSTILDGVDARSDTSSRPSTPRSSSNLWQRALAAAKSRPDPWASRELHSLPMERAVRHRYTPQTGQWTTDEVLVKMESRPFAAGAMRECFAAKQLSTFTHSTDWRKAHNMVAKRYKKEGVHSSAYFSDTLVQMDAKMLGEMYNKTDPPKQVDVMQCCILQLPARPGAPLLAAEQLIEGDYVKYNSNSGFVQGDDLLRHTPQAFSHFTWTLTRGFKICVDVQGVGDLYTDPQIHTLDGEGYGEGNLGLRGMGLFFRTHECNPLCARLGLKPFDRCESDVRAQGYSSEGSSSAASSAGLTMARTVARTSSMKARVAAARRAQATPLRSQTELLAVLQDVPEVEGPEALSHLEVAKLYGEVVLLPELRPAEDPADCLRGGLFHLGLAAQLGATLALLLLARAHLGIEPSLPQFAQLIKVGSKQGQFMAYPRVAWRAVELAAQRGVRGAALALAAAYGSGSGPLADEEGEPTEPDVAKAAKWCATALELPDLLAAAAAADDAVRQQQQQHAGGRRRHRHHTRHHNHHHHHGVIAEGDEGEVADEDEDGSGAAEDEDEDEGCVEEDAPPAKTSAGPALLDLKLALPTLDGPLKGLSLPKLDDLKPSKAFLERLVLQAEEEASALPGAAVARYELLVQYGKLLLAGGPSLEADPARASELFNEAAEAASAAGKGRLAQKYYELAAEAEGKC